MKNKTCLIQSLLDCWALQAQANCLASWFIAGISFSSPNFTPKVQEESALRLEGDALPHVPLPELPDLKDAMGTQSDLSSEHLCISSLPGRWDLPLSLIWASPQGWRPGSAPEGLGTKGQLVLTHGEVVRPKLGVALRDSPPVCAGSTEGMKITLMCQLLLLPRGTPCLLRLRSLASRGNNMAGQLVRLRGRVKFHFLMSFIIIDSHASLCW